MIVLLVAVPVFLSAGTADFQRLLTEGEAYYRKGIAGNEEAVGKAVERLEAALKLEPGHSLAMVFLGSAYTLVARDKKNPWVKLSWAKRGLDLIDRAVKQSPSDVRVRLERFMNNLNLPAVLKRDKFIRSDLEFLIPRMDDAPVSDEHLQLFYLDAGDYLQREGETDRAVVFWRRCTALNPDSSPGQRAEARVRIYRD